MSQFTVRKVVETRVEVVLATPTNWAELSKALSYCEHNKSSTFDDAVTVEAHDGEIVLWWPDDTP